MTSSEPNVVPDVAADTPTVRVLVCEIVRELRKAQAELAPTPLLLSADDAAAYLGMSKPSLYRAAAAGRVPRSYPTPGGPRWKRSELEAWAANLRRGTRSA